MGLQNNLLVADGLFGGVVGCGLLKVRIWCELVSIFHLLDFDAVVGAMEMKKTNQVSEKEE
jgi:hypothetical protein